MSPDGVDLEALAAGYRMRRPDDAVLAAAAAAAARLGPGSRAIDVGGGPGTHAAVLAATGAFVVVIDPSSGMVRRAAVAGPAVRARGEDLPVRSGVADLVYFHLSIHHGDPHAMLSEAVRASRAGGVVWVWTLAADHHRSSFLARWFPSIGEIDTARFPDPSHLVEMLQAEGCDTVEVESRVLSRTRPAGEWVEAVRAAFVSTLQLLDPGVDVVYEQRYTRVSARAGGDSG